MEEKASLGFWPLWGQNHKLAQRQLSIICVFVRLRPKLCACGQKCAPAARCGSAVDGRMYATCERLAERMRLRKAGTSKKELCKTRGSLRVHPTSGKLYGNQCWEDYERLIPQDAGGSKCYGGRAVWREVTCREKAEEV